MKKKTSLWISGITTVAMLAVAVGSFAAWDTLTPEAVSFDATAAGTSASLTVTHTGFDSNTLVPVGAVVADGEAEEITATFTPTIEVTKADDVDIQLVALPSIKLNNAEDKSVLKAIVYKTDDNTKTPVTVDTKLTANESYTVEVTYAKDANTIDGDSTKGQAIAVSVQCKATKKNPVSA